MDKPFSFPEHHAEKARRRAELDARIEDLRARGIPVNTITQDCASFPIDMLSKASMILPAEDSIL